MNEPTAVIARIRDDQLLLWVAIGLAVALSAGILFWWIERHGGIEL